MCVSSYSTYLCVCVVLNVLTRYRIMQTCLMFSGRLDHVTLGNADMLKERKDKETNRTKSLCKTTKYPLPSPPEQTRQHFMPCHPCHVFMMSVGTVSHHNECKASTQTFSHDRRTAAPPYSWRRQRRTSHFRFPFPSSPTVVMVSLTSVSPLLYASPNINRQTASLINTHQTS